MRSLFTICFLLLWSLGWSQNRTVGTVVLTDEALDGYTFFSPFSGRSAYMVDNCGALDNKWEQGTLPGIAAYFQESGNMLRTYKVSPVGPFTSASNAGGLALVNWENETVWSYELNTETELSHHDAVELPNGNFLMLTWELIFAEELISLGRDENEIAPQGFSWGERIIEVKPIGTNDIEIVWEWRIKEHLVQDQNDALSNFGVIADHAELFDINLPDISSSNSHSDFDYNHFNAIDYNEELDQILISARNSDEIWILDHSTTTAEAASHEGGNSGMGGDILFRWGNPLAYKGASISKQRLFGQHGVNWIKDGPEKDKILIFNNGNGRPGTDFSTVEILVPPLQEDGTYIKDVGIPFGPDATEWVYGDEPAQQFYSAFLSNAQYLSNGNILINAGSPGDIIEINPQKEIVWEYIIPLFGDFPATQGDNVNNNSTFRAYKFPVDFAGFAGIEIEAGNTIEENPILFDACKEVNGVEAVNEQLDLSIYYSEGMVHFINPDLEELNIECFDIMGRLLSSFEFDQTQFEYSIQSLPKGIVVFKAISKKDTTVISTHLVAIY